MGTFDIKWLIPTVLFAITAIATVWRYVLKPYLDERQRTKEEQCQALRTICRALKELLSKVSQYYSLEVYVVKVQDEYSDPSLFLAQQVENPLIAKVTRRKLKRLSELKQEYESWRIDAISVLDGIISKELELRKELTLKWNYLVKEHGMPVLEAKLQRYAYPKLFQGMLTPEQVKNAMMEEYGPDYAVPFPLPGTQAWASGPPPIVKELEGIQKEPLLKLREHILDTRQFHLLIEELRKAGNRAVVRKFAAIQKEFHFYLAATLDAMSKKT